MNSFDAELWRQANRVLQQILERPAAERLAVLDEQLGDGPLKLLVTRLLNASTQTPLTVAAGLPASGDALLDTAAPDLCGRQIGPYLLQQRIGSGGMSSVYRAQRADGAHDLPVALKLLHPALLGSNWQQRFQREAQLLARLRHPGIAALLDAGVAEDGSPWLVTELVDGETIDRYCERKRLGPVECVRLVLDLCLAVAFVQRNLIVHRDLKCQNVMVSRCGEVKLLDFGIARMLGPDDSGAEATRVFTPEYAAPEQLRCEPATTATDVYSLGVVLYRLLTGTLPQSREPASRKLQPARAASLRDQQQARLRVRAGLDAVLDKALSEQAEQRYENAQSLAADLQAWLEYRPVQARPPGLWQRMGLFLRRQRQLAAALALAGLLGAAGLSATLHQASEARRQAQEARQAQAQADAVAEFLIELFEAADPDRPGAAQLPVSELLAEGSRKVRAAFADQEQLRNQMLLVLARIEHRLGRIELAAELLDDSSIEQQGSDQQKAWVWLLRSYQSLEQAEFTAADQAAAAGLRELGVPTATPLSVELLLNRAKAQSRLGQHAEALGSAAVARDLAESAVSVDLRRRLRLSVLSELAGLLFSAEQFDAALQVAEQAWQLAQAPQMPAGPSFTALHHYALVLNRLGRLERALELQREALSVIESSYPSLHQRRAELLAGLAARLSVLGEFAEAERHFEQALALFVALDQSPPTTLLNSHGLLLLRMERAEEAVAPLQLARDQAVHSFGSEDSRSLRVEFSLRVARAISEPGPHLRTELEPLFEQLALLHGAQHPVTVSAALAISDLDLRQARHEQALHWTRLALAAMDADLELHGRQRPAALAQKAQALAGMGRLEEAEARFEAALDQIAALGRDAGWLALRVLEPYVAFLAHTREQPQRALELIEQIDALLSLNADSGRPQDRRLLQLRAELRSDSG